jgi:hypothetical protein
MTDLQGFWSYVHADDQAESGRISQLARDVVSQYEMLTGENINLFLDKDAIEWGERWRDKIDNSLTSVGFFVAVLTPRYFMSAECRRELQFFARRAVDLGIRDLILPLVYVDIPSLHDQEATDDLVNLVREFQWDDWTEVRFSDLDSGQYRERVSKLAARIVEANRQAEGPQLSDLALQADTTRDTNPLMGMSEELHDHDNGDEQFGTIDLLADAEEKMGIVPATLDELTKEIVKIGEIMRQGTEDVQRPNNAKSGFAYRQMILRQTALQLHEPVERIWSLSNDLSSHMHTVDQGYRIIIERAKEEINENIDNKESFCSFFNAVRHLVASAQYSIESMEGMIKSTEPLNKLSRDLRPVLRRLRQGLTIMIELRGLYQEWINLIDATGIECEADDVANQAES